MVHIPKPSATTIIWILKRIIIIVAELGKQILEEVLKGGDKDEKK